LKSTETQIPARIVAASRHFSNFGSLKSTETIALVDAHRVWQLFQQFRLVEEH